MADTHVINALTLAAVRYSLSWEAVADFGGELYGLTPTALQTLSGPIESTATPTVESGVMLLAPGAVSTVPRAYFQGQTNSALTLSATARLQGQTYTQSYSVPGWPWAEDQPRTVPMARHLQGSTWQLKLESDGAAWSIRIFEIAIGQVLRTR